ncbi:hypothetical protein R3P38DRAFT_2811921 [Favolaschia claudopus]|uniref:Uncharacterized protein n=1 Tax=Favolaschia claudopus TaxID=2862362 RepID=A0AAV9Z8P0_9AGAR
MTQFPDTPTGTETAVPVALQSANATIAGLRALLAGLHVDNQAPAGATATATRQSDAEILAAMSAILAPAGATATATGQSDAAILATMRALLADVESRVSTPAAAPTPAPPAPGPAITASPALAIPAPMVTAAPAPGALVFRTSAPWIAGFVYIVIPLANLSAVAEPAYENEEDSPTWYCITRGKYVGVIMNHTLAHGAVAGVSGNRWKSHKTQALALQDFNDALTCGLVAVVP